MATEEVKTETPLARIGEIGNYEGQAVEIRGWLYNLRESGKLIGWCGLQFLPEFDEIEVALSAG
jgi:hypothetical protein